MGNTLVATVFFLPAALLASFLHLLQAVIQVHTAVKDCRQTPSVCGLEMM